MVDMEVSATIPVEMITPERRRIRDLRPGETAYTVFTALKANSRGQCFLQGNDWVERVDSFEKIQVSRDEKGFHVLVPADVQVMRLRRPDRFVFFFSLFRVVSVAVGLPRVEKLGLRSTSKEQK
jgi:hypothetical protein